MTDDRTHVRKALMTLAHDAQWHGDEAGELGMREDDGTKVVEVAGRPGWVWVRIQRAGGGVTQTVALNTRVRNDYGVKVWVGRNQDGVLAVKSIREADTVEQHGASAALVALPAYATAQIIETRRIAAGRVYPRLIDGAYTMQVYVDAFAYAWNTDIQVWPGGWIDLTSHIPGSGLRRIALVGIEPTTNTLTAVDGATASIAVTLTANDLASIDRGSMIPLAGVILTYGMTAVDRESLIIDARHWWSGMGYGPLTAVRHNASATTAPGATDDSADDYGVGSLWVDVTNDAAYICADATAGAAIWLPLEGGGASEATWDVDLAPASASAFNDEFNDETIDTGKWTRYGAGGTPTWTEAGTTLTLTPTGDNAGIYQAVANLATTNWTYIVKTTNATAGLIGIGAYNSSTPAWITSWAIASGTHWLRIRHVASSGTMQYDRSTDGLVWVAGGSTTLPTCDAIGVVNTVECTIDYFRGYAEFHSNTQPCPGAMPITVDHGNLTGLDGDDHTQYYNETRGDARYAQLGHTHAESDITDLDHTDAAAIHDNVSGEIAAVTEKTAPVSADLLIIEDSGATNAKKRVQVGNLAVSKITVSTSNVATPPSDSELDSAFGEPGTVGAGFVRLLNDNGDGANVYLVASDGTNWWHCAMTKAT